MAKISGYGQKWLEMAGMAGNGQIELDMVGKGQIWLGMTGNDWKWLEREKRLEMAANLLK